LKNKYKTYSFNVGKIRVLHDLPYFFMLYYKNDIIDLNFNGGIREFWQCECARYKNSIFVAFRFFIGFYIDYNYSNHWKLLKQQILGVKMVLFIRDNDLLMISK